MSDRREKRTHLWARDEHDWYVEPTRATTALLAVETFSGTCWDPACGGGNITSTLRAAGLRAIGSDVVDRGCPEFVGLLDFLEQPETRAPNIISNPPFFRAAGAERFARNALAVATGKVALFVDIRFLAGADRAAGIWAEHPPHRVWIVTPRVSCPPGTYLAAGNKAGNGSSDWCWLVWDRGAPAAPPALGWLHAPQQPVDVFA